MARNTKRSAIRGRNRTATGSSRASRNGFHTIRKSPHDQRPQNMEAQHSGAPLQRNQGRGRPQRDTDARCRRSREGRVPFRGDQGSGSSLGKGGSRLMPPAGFDPPIPLKQTAALYGVSDRKNAGSGQRVSGRLVLGGLLTFKNKK